MEDEVTYNRTGDNKDDKDSIKVCLSTDSDYKYKIFYASGQKYTFTKNKLIENKFDAVSSTNYYFNILIKYFIEFTLL